MISTDCGDWSLPASVLWLNGHYETLENHGNVKKMCYTSTMILWLILPWKIDGPKKKTTWKMLLLRWKYLANSNSFDIKTLVACTPSSCLLKHRYHIMMFLFKRAFKHKEVWKRSLPALKRRSAVSNKKKTRRQRWRWNGSAGAISIGVLEDVKPGKIPALHTQISNP